MRDARRPLTRTFFALAAAAGLYLSIVRFIDGDWMLAGVAVLTFVVCAMTVQRLWTDAQE
jgi:hypothetical protein